MKGHIKHKEKNEKKRILSYTFKRLVRSRRRRIYVQIHIRINSNEIYCTYFCVHFVGRIPNFPNIMPH